MCSILFTNKKIENFDLVNNYIQLRGPDATSHLRVGKYNFVHNLLSMTGTFTTQPLIENNCFSLFNGEIYNYKNFGDYDNDSKCIVPVYKKFGTEFTRKLDGEFAIVLLDLTARRIIVSTDVFSCKPLWMGLEGGEFGFASYGSALTALGFKKVEKIAANTTYIISLDNLEIISKKKVYDFDIQNQKNLSFHSWNLAFTEAVRKRAVTNVREKVFIGMSSGYDSGAIACELLCQKVPFKVYSVVGAENKDVLFSRFDMLRSYGAEIEEVLITPTDREKAHQYIEKNVEEFKYRIYSASGSYNEFNLRLQDDNGANSLSHICSLASRDRKKIYLSGMGADEIFSDYGFKGEKKYPHSNFGGLFPENLEDIFPWPSFYESSMVSYLTKEEYVAGSYGLEARYPFLDKRVVQEFLWLHPSLKNSYYKSVLHNYLSERKFPFAVNEKIGF